MGKFYQIRIKLDIKINQLNNGTIRFNECYRNRTNTKDID